ncbi:unnamed protein product [Linum trigynum]|uniref:Uncharacterized protein n=1 Tax=Linum trigynum TaxID=586398 RepID=A0AAV2DTV8_9ROSI
MARIKRVPLKSVSMELIKPSSPTPHKLRRYPLSSLDQLSPSVAMPVVLFFTNNNYTTNTQRCNLLKQSLSRTLTHFYPMAGRLRDNLFIDCSDEGVPFLEARIDNDTSMSEFLQDPSPGHLNDFLPLKVEEANDLLAAFQATYFNCGGMALTFQMSHKLGDGLSIFFFLTAWASIARDSSSTTTFPEFNFAEIFPPINLPVGSGSVARPAPYNKVTAKRFVFSASTIAHLKTRYAEESLRPTRLEALSAFISTRLLKISNKENNNDDDQDKNKNKKKKIFTVSHSVNLRSKMDPPLPENAFGNLFTSCIAVTDLDNQQQILRKMREGTRAVDGDAVRMQLQQGGRGSVVSSLKEKEVKGEVQWVPFVFTSLCRMPLYDVDFGWGKPLWFGVSAESSFVNVVTFVDRKEGGGIEAWVNLKEEDMAEFEADEEIVALVSPTALNL